MTTAANPNGFIRFIDAIGHILTKAEPVVLQVAEEAEPVLALTPLGPEYDLTVEAIAGAQKVAAASIAAGTTLSNPDKFGLALAAATPALKTILTSKGVTADQQTHITTWVQNIFNILAGPVANIAATIKSA